MVRVGKLIALGAVLALVGCGTLPEPAGTRDGLLVVPVVHTNETDYDYFGHYKLIVDTSTSRVVKKLSPAMSYVFLSGLGPGPLILETEFWYGDRARPGSSVMASSLPLAPGQITVNNRYLEVFLIEDGDRIRMGRRWHDVSREMRDEVLQDIAGYRNRELWGQE